MVQKEIYFVYTLIFCVRDIFLIFVWGEEYMKPGGGGHTLYGADKRGGAR